MVADDACSNALADRNSPLGTQGNPAGHASDSSHQVGVSESAAKSTGKGAFDELILQGAPTRKERRQIDGLGEPSLSAGFDALQECKERIVENATMRNSLHAAVTLASVAELGQKPIPKGRWLPNHLWQPPR